MLNIVDAVLTLNKRKQALGDNKKDLMSDTFELDNGAGIDRVVTKVSADGLRMLASGYDLDLSQMALIALQMGSASTSAVLHEVVEEVGMEEDGEESNLIPGEMLEKKVVAQGSSLWIDGLITGLMLADLRQKYPEKDGVNISDFFKGEGM